MAAVSRGLRVRRRRPEDDSRRVAVGRLRPLSLRALAALGLTLAFILPASARGEDVCAECHDPEPALAESVHSFLDCADCHPGAAEVPHPEEGLEAACGDCHEEAVAKFETSIHAEVATSANGETLDCAACHGSAHELAYAHDPASPVHPQRLAATCGRCHSDPALAQRFALRLVRPIEAYQASVHARGVERGEAAATCGDCHESHAVRPAADPASRVHHRRVPETCGRCHQEVAAAYARSIHGRAAALGVRDSPVCTDCHGEHRILSPREKGSPVYASNVPKMTCGRCHGDLRLAEKYGIAGDKVPSWQDSYHGLAMRAGAASVAHCGSCHGVHDILPSTDPESSVAPARLAATCGRCHPGAGRVFAIGPVHVLPEQHEHLSVVWARRIYLFLIYTVIGALALHNLLDLWRKARSPQPRPAPAAGSAERMSKGFRIAHALLVVSFAVLVYTGFALKYSESWWAEPLLQWEEGLGLRGGLHRVAAVVLLGAAALHVGHLALDRRARACIRAMLPTRADGRELVGRLEYFAGRRAAPPPAEPVAYPEKIEYLAVVWGTAVMTVTGFVLWFESFFLTWLPKWALDLATVIHFYEAVLAALAIVVWHLYSVIFDPVVYPMDPAWLTGRAAPGRSHERLAAAPEPPAPRTRPKGNKR